MLFNENEIGSQMIELLKKFPWHSSHALSDYYAQTYYYVRHSEKLLALAGALMKEEDRLMQRRFLKHLHEEGAHDLMIKKDLENLGQKLDQWPERPETRIFWETQYYKVQFEDPAALLGYILFLETVASKVCTWMAGEIAKTYPKAITFLKVHGEEDVEHVKEALKYVTSLPVERQNKIKENLIQSERAYMLMILAILQDQRKLKASA